MHALNFETFGPVLALTRAHTIAVFESACFIAIAKSPPFAMARCLLILVVTTTLVATTLGIPSLSTNGENLAMTAPFGDITVW
jgi:hypothetical protein